MGSSLLFDAFLQQADFVLTEGSIYERLRRHPEVVFDPYVAHAGLLYDELAARLLEQVHREYLDVGQQYGLPMVIGSNTWRASQERIQKSPFKGRRVNQDNVRFMQALRDTYGEGHAPIFIAGQLSCRGDAYRPEEALSSDEAEAFHAYQVDALAEAGVDFLLAATLPARSEALGLARAMAKTDLPYVLSFVLRGDGTLLDGTPLAHAIADIDASVDRQPVGYLVNCVHPTIFRSGVLRNDIPEGRLLGLQANTSARSPEELDGLTDLETEEPERFAQLMREVQKELQLPIMGGCCGTDTRHIACLAQRFQR